MNAFSNNITSHGRSNNVPNLRMEISWLPSQHLFFPFQSLQVHFGNARSDKKVGTTKYPILSQPGHAQAHRLVRNWQATLVGPTRVTRRTLTGTLPQRQWLLLRLSEQWRGAADCRLGNPRETTLRCSEHCRRKSAEEKTEYWTLMSYSIECCLRLVLPWTSEI